MIEIEVSSCAEDRVKLKVSIWPVEPVRVLEVRNLILVFMYLNTCS